MFVRILVVFLAVSGATQAVDEIPEVCGLDIVPKMTEEQKEQASEAMQGSEDTSGEDIPDGAVLIGDMILNREQARAAKNRTNGGKEKRNVIKDERYIWNVNRPVHWALHPLVNEEADSVLVGNIRKALQTIEEYTCIRFERVDSKEKDPEKFHILFLKSAKDSTRSYVGKQQIYNQENGLKQNYQVILLKATVPINAILHEIMHALGFNHEQERPDRDIYVKINYENIKEAARHNFVIFEEGTVETFDEPYDFNSVMHYAHNAFGRGIFKKATTIEPTENYRTVEGQPRVIGPLESLTAGDVRKLNKLFKCDMPSKEEIDAAKEAAREYLDKLYEKIIIKKVAQDYVTKLYKEVIDKVEGGVCELYEKKNNNK